MENIKISKEKQDEIVQYLWENGYHMKDKLNLNEKNLVNN